ncbi:MAG: YbaB/EbfC family nucleoid-associated protein [Deltaproteobacteria bacterium]|nr:YbaB/EbfC family nucleoid-associated protein [Deltaproteobacteria bacterium]
MKITEIMKQAQELQKKLAKQHEELGSKVFEAASGGGMVTVKTNGKGEILSVKLDPEIVAKDDVEMLEDLIVAAVNEALKRVREATQDEMSGMMGNLGLKIPGF